MERLRAGGAALIDLTESNPTRAGLAYPADEIRAALADPRALEYAPDARGMASARAAVAGYYAEAGVAVDAERIVLTASSSEAYGWLFKLLCDPGDQVLIPKPSYPLFDFLTALEEVGTVPYPLRWDGEWHVDLPAFRAALTERTRAVLVVSPNNPTGNALQPIERAALEQVCAERGIPLIADEVFLDYPARPGARLASVLEGEGPALRFALNGLSKAAGLPQLKLGWIAVAGPPALVSDALARLEVIADTYLSVNTPVQLALPRLFGAATSIRAAILSRVRANRAWLAGEVRATDPVRLLACEAGWYAILTVPRTLSDQERALELVEKDGVLIQPGYFFDMPGEGFLVLSLLTKEDAFREGAARILARVRAEV